MIIQFNQEVLEKSNKPVIIKSFATWCPHCTKMKPIYEELEKELGQKYIFAEFDVDKYQELTSQLKVSSLPTFIFIKNKKEMGRELGEMSKEDLKKFIQKYLD